MLLTSIFLLIFTFIPGRTLGLITKLPDWLDLQLMIGLIILPLVLFFGRFFLPANILLLLYISTVLLLFTKHRLKFRLPNIVQPALLFIALGVIAQSLPYLKTVFLNSDQIITAIADNHDQAWHLSLINELVHSFPPQIPGFSGLTLKNYHYFYDLILAANVSLFKTNPTVLLQLYYPVLLSALFGLSAYRILTKITDNQTLRSLGVLMVFFSNNLSYLFYPLGLKLFDSNSLLIDQPLFFIFNQQTVFSLALLFYLFIILDQQIKKPLLARAVLIGIILASLAYIKIYGFVIAIISIGFLSLKQFKKTLPVLIIAGLIAITIVLLTYIPGQSWLSFQPLWLVSAFTDKLIFPYLPKLYALSTQPWFSLLILTAILILNYHLRLLGFVYLFVKKKTTLLNLIFLSTIVSLTILFLGFQSHSPFNIIQFAPYATTGLAVLTIGIFTHLKPKLGYILACLVLLLSLPTSLRTINTFARTKSELPPLRQEYLSIIKSLAALPSGLTLSLVDRDYHLIPDPNRDLNFIGNNLISSIGQKQAYFNDVKQLQVLGIDYQPRLDQINHLKHNFCQDKSLLINQKIQYLIVADDLWHCLGEPTMEFKLINQTANFGLYSLKLLN